MLDVGPASVRAIVVGIDHYGYGADWDLNGPGADALRMADWLLDCDVPAANIDVFLSPRSWTAAYFTEWLAGQSTKQTPAAPRTAFMRHDATHGGFVDFINHQLALGASTALFVYWGGHGVVSQTDGSNFLFTTEARLGSPYSVSVQELLLALQQFKFSQFAEQIFIIDACANSYLDANDNTQLKAGAFFTANNIDAAISQCVLFASSQGKVAANISERGTGLFTSLLLEQLRPLKSPRRGDFAAAFHDVRSDGANNGLLDQQPTLALLAPGLVSVRDRQRQLSREAQELLNLIRARKVPLDVLKSSYLHSLPDYSRNFLDDEMERWLLDLQEQKPPSKHSMPPLIEFASRIGHVQADDVLRDWAEARTDPFLSLKLAGKLDAEARGSRPLATLFLELDSARPTELRWWLVVPGAPGIAPVSVAIDDTQVLRSELERYLSGIVADALVVAPPACLLRVGFVIPEDLFLSDLGSVGIQMPGTSRKRPLNERFGVVYHWRPRLTPEMAMHGSPWKELLQYVAPRIPHSASTTVLWFDSDPASNQDLLFHRATSELCEGHAQAHCLGIDHPHDNTLDLTLDTLRACLDFGVPCFFWLPRPAEPGAAAEARALVDATFARHPARSAAVNILQQRVLAAPTSAIRNLSVVWDTPDFLPPNQQMQS